jgi:F-type H+-transporting ATPase subunit b
MLELDVGTIIFQIANFLVLAVLLYYLLFRPVMRTARERRAEKERLLGELNRDRQEAAQKLAELEARLARTDEEAEALVARAQDRAEAERRSILHEAHEEVERILVEAHADAHRLRQQAADEFHDQILDAILETSSRLIHQATPEEVHDRLVQELNDRIWEMGRDEMQRVEAFRRALGTREPTASVASARPLSAEQQGLLARTFTALADRHVNVELRIDPSLAAGLKVRLGDVLVDNSIGGQLDTLRENVAAALKERLPDG